MSTDIGINFAIVNNIQELQKTLKARLHMILWCIGYVFKLKYVHFVENNEGKYFFFNLKINVACLVKSRRCQSCIRLSANQQPAFRKVQMATSV